MNLIMFNWDVVEWLLYIGVITAGIVSYGVVIAHREDRDRDAESPANTLKKTA
jgi:hypothetical protein